MTPSPDRSEDPTREVPVDPSALTPAPPPRAVIRGLGSRLPDRPVPGGVFDPTVPPAPGTVRKISVELPIPRCAMIDLPNFTSWKDAVAWVRSNIDPMCDDQGRVCVLSFIDLQPEDSA